MTAPVTVTDRAAERTAQTVSNDPENNMLRVSVEGGGCSGETRTAGNRMTFDTIRSDFAFLDDWEDRYRYVIELGRGLPPLPEAYRTDSYKVRGCASQVWLATETEHRAGGVTVFRFHGDSDAHIVRGLIAILFAIYSGKTADDLLGIDAEAIFAKLGLKEHLTPQRSNGFAAMVERIRTDARHALSEEAKAA